VDFYRLKRNNNNIVFSTPQGYVEIPWQVATVLFKEGLGLAKTIENEQNPERLIFDQAILRRAGLPVGLSDNKAIQEEAIKESQWNSKLRRYMRGFPGIPSKAKFGTPTVINKAPR
jgi:hypothetical protein